MARPSDPSDRFHPHTTNFLYRARSQLTPPCHHLTRMLTSRRSRRPLSRARRTPEPPPPPALSSDAGAAASSRALAGGLSRHLLPRARRTPEPPPCPRGRRLPGAPIPPPVPAAVARSPAARSRCRSRVPTTGSSRH
ncbi:hypothetical protein VPH35_110259 [Triticum aestivum]